MKTIFLALLMLISLSIKAQDNNPYGFECSFPGDPPDPASSALIGGYYKPESIADYTSETGAYFPVLIVYVQFTDDPGAEVSHWPSTNSGPTFMGDVIATTKASGYGNNWWDAYNGSTETLSDYWMEVSRGKLHLVGKEVSVVLPHDVDWYEANGNLPQAMEDLFVALQNNEEINWPLFDKWSKVNGDFVYGDGDGYVDFMYIVARSNPCSEYSPGWGYFRPEGVFNACTHGNEHTVYNSGGVEIKLKRDFSETGSGFQISPGGCGNGVMYAPMQKWATISFTEHEHGHYFFGWGVGSLGGHQLYSKVNNNNGVEEYLSPYELIKLGYQDPEVVDFSTIEHTIDDWTSRSTGSEILKVPIGSENQNEFFLIANRQQVSYYDKIMWGDTCHDNPYRVRSGGGSADYAKGIYIYHAYPGSYGSDYPWGIDIDQECADGLFTWSQDGYQHPDWSCTQDIPYYKHSTVIYNYNDNGGAPYYGLTYHDGKSLENWFGIGLKEYPNCQYGDGTTREYTNYTEVWTSREQMGDRYDAWKVSYNEVFSPYSSPSTYNWSNQNSEIFIYLESQNGTSATLQIYHVGDGGYDLDEILEATPPSRPMLFKIEAVECNDDYALPKITWENNKEPDMLRTGDFKRYYIYRAYANGGDLPVSYQYLETYDDYSPDDTASYIDRNDAGIYCGYYSGPGEHFRYKVIAFDKYETPSVFSDFISTLGLALQGDNPMPGNNNETPIAFSVSNYPNPFNPATTIKYSLPKNTFVTIKVYNIIGELIRTLVNGEYKNAGYYDVLFDGTNLASGIYFYTIEAGEFKASKKMVLVK